MFEVACIALKKIYGFVETARFGVPRCNRDNLHAGLCCAARRSPALTFVWLFERRSELFVEISGCRIQVISESAASEEVLLQDACSRDYVLPEDGFEV